MASLLAGEMILKPIPGPTMVMGVMRGGGCPAPPLESELYFMTVNFIYVAILM